MHSSHPETHPATARDNSLPNGMHDSSLRRLLRRAIETLCAGMLIVTVLGPVCAEEPPAPAEILVLPTVEPSDPTPEPPDPTPAVVDPVTIDPFIKLRGSVWRTKAGIVFLKTPIGLLSLTSKTTLKDLKASQEVYFWVHERYVVVEIRKRTDGSLVHRYLSGPMTSGAGEPRTLRCWGPDGDLIVQVGTQEERLVTHREGDLLTVEVDETNTISGVHDLAIRPAGQPNPAVRGRRAAPPFGNRVQTQIQLRLCPNPDRPRHAQFEDWNPSCEGGTTVDLAHRP